MEPADQGVCGCKKGALPWAPGAGGHSEHSPLGHWYMVVAEGLDAGAALQSRPLNDLGAVEQKQFHLLPQALLAGNPPAIFAALDSCFAALIAASPTTTLAYAVRLAATLQAEVAEPPSSSKLDGVPAAACCALLCLCKSMLQQLASTLGHQQLVGCAVEGCSEGKWVGGTGSCAQPAPIRGSRLYHRKSSTLTQSAMHSAGSFQLCVLAESSFGALNVGGTWWPWITMASASVAPPPHTHPGMQACSTLPHLLSSTPTTTEGKHPMCPAALTSLTLTPSGLQLAPRPPAALDAERSAPPAGFSAAEQQAAEQFLLVWRAGTAGQAELDKVTAAWQGVPLLRANGNRSLESRFQPLPVASLAPRMKVSDWARWRSTWCAYAGSAPGVGGVLE